MRFGPSCMRQKSRFAPGATNKCGPRNCCNSWNSWIGDQLMRTNLRWRNWSRRCRGLSTVPPRRKRWMRRLSLVSWCTSPAVGVRRGWVSNLMPQVFCPKATALPCVWWPWLLRRPLTGRIPQPFPLCTLMRWSRRSFCPPSAASVRSAMWWTACI